MNRLLSMAGTLFFAGLCIACNHLRAPDSVTAAAIALFVCWLALDFCISLWKPTRGSPWKRGALLVGVAALVAFASINVIDAYRTFEPQLIQTPGEYPSHDRKFSLRISADSGNSIRYAVTRASTGHQLFAGTVGSAQNPWGISWDRLDHLWVCGDKEAALWTTERDGTYTSIPLREVDLTQGMPYRFRRLWNR